MTSMIGSDPLDLDRTAAVRRELRLDLSRWLAIGRRRLGRRQPGRWRAAASGGGLPVQSPIELGCLVWRADCTG